MQLGTSTNLLCFRPDGSRLNLCRTLEILSDGGFKCFDLNFYDWSRKDSPFLTEAWEQWIEEAARTADRLGVTFGQCHGYFYDFLNPSMSDEEKIYHKMLQERSFECLRRLGAHTCVLHPETDRNSMDLRKGSLQANLEYLKPAAEKLVSMNIRLAIENMCDYQIAPKRKYCAYPDELMELVKSFKSGHVGVCWDFEHADIMRQNQTACLKYIGDALFATHVSDTHSGTDNTLMHVLPMTGNILWEEIMKTLAEIDYHGDFCYEAHNFLNRLPNEVIPEAISLAYAVGEYLMGIYEKAAKGGEAWKSFKK